MMVFTKGLEIQPVSEKERNVNERKHKVLKFEVSEVRDEKNRTYKYLLLLFFTRQLMIELFLQFVRRRE